MSQEDGAGLTVALDDAAAAAAWDATVSGFLAHSAATPAHLGRVLERAPGFALGWAAKGLFLLLLGRSELVPAARAARDRAARSLGETTPREGAYLAALDAWLAGRPTRAAAILDDMLTRHPADALALKLVHGIRFILGDAAGMLSSTAGAIRHYGAAHPHAGYAMGCLAFALEENGDYAAAERCGRGGLELAPDDAWGLHAVAHVYDMTGRARDGIAWLARQPGRWAHCNNFGYHVWWHLALFHLDRGEFDRVLALYDARIRAEHTDDYRDIANGASMLVRLEIEGIDVGDRWDELAALAAGRVEDGAVVFADLHYLMALNGGGRTAEAEALLERLAADAQRRDHDMHEVAAVAGLPAARGLAAFRAGNYDIAFEKLAESRAALPRIGGSHAQRDVFSRLMVEAAIRARRWAEAEQALVSRSRARGAEDGFTARRRAAIARLRTAGLAAE